MMASEGRRCCCKLCICSTVYCLILPLVCLLGFVLGLLNMAVLIVPALLYQLYRLVRIIFNRCPCFVK